MIPQRIVGYLHRNGVPFTRVAHPRAVSAQELAGAMGVSGRSVAKTVVLEADGQRFIALVPANRQIDLLHLAAAIDARALRFVEETEFASMFPDCEVGAEPPFGRLFGVPVIADSTFVLEDEVVLRAGSHEEALSLHWYDFVALERPLVASFSRLPDSAGPMETQLGL